jgi:hypothetical protein
MIPPTSFKPMRWQVHEDGSFDLLDGPVSLLGAYPAFDRQCVRSAGVELHTDRNGTEITYRTCTGAIRLFLGTLPDGGVFLDSAIEGMEVAPQWFHPFHDAAVQDAVRLFRQGIGMSGPSGFVTMEGRDDPWLYESFLVTALIAKDGGTLAWGALDHADFLHRSTLGHHVVRHNFRNREIAHRSTHASTGFATEKIPLRGVTRRFPRLIFLNRPTVSPALEAVARQIGEEAGHRPRSPSYHWCSWYHRSAFFTHAELVSFLDHAAAQKEPFAAVQIDDGYSAAEGDWLLPHDRWPGGLERAFADIQERGYRPGVWIAPFMVECRSRLAREHPEWLLRWNDGSLVVKWERFDGTANSEEYYLLDSSHPEAFAYLQKVFRQLHAWGARMFKTDFMEWACVDSFLVQRHTPGKTSFQYHHEVLRMIRETIGEESYWLGCIAFFAPFIGWVDAMRMTSDTAPHWPDIPPSEEGPAMNLPNVIFETYHTLYLNNLLFQNDPDCLYLRPYHIGLSDREITALALFMGTLGVVISTSDRIPELPPERQALWRFVRPQDKPWTARLPFFGEETDLYTAVRSFETTGGYAVVVLNHSAARRTYCARVEDWIGEKEAEVFAWGPEGATSLGRLSAMRESLEKHEARLYYLSPEGSPPPADLTLGGYGV